MKAAGTMLIAAVLLLSPGCVKQPDWIESTLVTVDVTGVWEGTWSGGIIFGGLLTSRNITLTLEQEGPRVKGRYLWGLTIAPVGTLEGRVGGDVFHFNVMLSPGEVLTGEVTVGGDDMEGTFSGATVRNARMLLRRVDSPPRPQAERP